MNASHDFRRSRLALAVSAAMAAGAFGAPALAATFIVTLATDTVDGGTSLREAVDEANANPGIDIIEFDAGLIGSTIETDPAQGNIQVTDSLLVQGPGSNNLTIMPSDDSGDAVLFNHSGADVSVTGVTIDGGGASGSRFAIGGGSSGTSFTASDVVIENFGQASSPLYLFNDQISISDSIFRNNSSSGSGAMALFSHVVSINNVQVTGNSSSFGGGGIHLGVHTSAEIVDSVISDNNTGGQGGGVIVSSTGEFTINGTTIADNTGESGGGGIYWNTVSWDPGTLRIINSTLSGNTTTTADLVNDASAGSGGGLLIDNQTTFDYELDVLQSTFSGNTAAGAGGGIFIGLRTAGSTIEIAHSTITDNTAEFSGGLLAITDSTTPDAADVEVSHTVIAGNTGSTDGTDAGDSTGETATGDDAVGDTINATYSFLDMVGTNVIPDADSTISGGDPGLGALDTAPYGNRTTAVHIPDETSPLVDAGDGSLTAGSGNVPVNDQTGAERIVNAIIDIGAVEFNPDPPASGGGGGGGAISGGLLGLLAGLLFRRRRLRQ